MISSDSKKLMQSGFTIIVKWHAFILRFIYLFEERGEIGTLSQASCPRRFLVFALDWAFCGADDEKCL